MQISGKEPATLHHNAMKILVYVSCQLLNESINFALGADDTLFLKSFLDFTTQVATFCRSKHNCSGTTDERTTNKCIEKTEIVHNCE